MKKLWLIVFLSTVFYSLLPAAAQNTGSTLCANISTGKIRPAIRCTSRETEMTVNNFAKVIGATVAGTPTPVATGTPSSSDATGIDYSSCYKTSGVTRGSPQLGQLSVSVQCSRSSQIMISHEFSTDDRTFAYPALQEQVLSYAGTVPSGVMIATRGQPNKFYTLNVTAVCCNLLN